MACVAGSALAATETLFSNSAFSVAPGPEEGTLWVLSRGDVASGMTLLNLKVGKDDVVQVVKSKQELLASDESAVQDGIFTDGLAEHRRIPYAIAGKLGLVLPRFGEDSDGHYLVPQGFFSVRRLDGRSIYASPIEFPAEVEELDTAMDYAASRDMYSYFLGEDLFVCPMIERKAKTRRVHLPKGEWIGFWSGKAYAGEAAYTVPAPLGQTPVFYRKNSAFADLFRRAAEENK